MPKGIPLSPEKIQKIEKMIWEGFKWPSINERYGISRATYHDILQRIKKDWRPVVAKAILLAGAYGNKEPRKSDKSCPLAVNP